MLYHLGTEQEKVILFIDILGFSELVRKNNGLDVYDGNPHNLALILPHFYNGIAIYHFSKRYQEDRRVKFLWISDSIVISTELENVNVLIEELIYIQNQMYSGHLAFRGSICIGNLYHEDNIWGEPLVRAVELEKDNSITLHPRIVISKIELKKLSLNDMYNKYFKQNELNSDYMYFSVFDPNIDNLLNKKTPIIHSVISV